MSVTLTNSDYAAAWRLITATTNHDKNIAEVVESKVLRGLRSGPTLLDVGAGSGAVSLRIAPHFSRMTLVEQNGDQIAANRGVLDDLGAEVFDGSFTDFTSTEKFDVVLCSHVFYHVPRPEWSRFIDRLLSFVRPGGVCIVVLVGGPTDGAGHPLAALPPERRSQPVSHTTHDAMRKDFTQGAVDTDMFVAELGKKDVRYEVVSTMNTWSADSVEQMYQICKFVVFEDCLTPDQVADMTEHEAHALDTKIRGHAEACPHTDGVYRLEMEDGVVIITP